MICILLQRELEWEGSFDSAFSWRWEMGGWIGAGSMGPGLGFISFFIAWEGKV